MCAAEQFCPEDSIAERMHDLMCGGSSSRTSEVKDPIAVDTAEEDEWSAYTQQVIVIIIYC